MKLELGLKIYHKDLYDGKEPLEIVGIRKNEVELEGDFSGGNHNICQKSWFPIEGIIMREYSKFDVRIIIKAFHLDFVRGNYNKDLLEWCENWINYNIDKNIDFQTYFKTNNILLDKIYSEKSKDKSEESNTTSEYPLRGTVYPKESEMN